VPPYVGAKGWIGVRLDYEVDWEELGDILRDGYALSAPKRLLKLLADGRAATPPPVKRRAAARRPKAGTRAKAPTKASQSRR
jgi:hypothetical protein